MDVADDTSDLDFLGPHSVTFAPQPSTRVDRMQLVAVAAAAALLCVLLVLALTHFTGPSDASAEPSSTTFDVSTLPVPGR